MKLYFFMNIDGFSNCYLVVNEETSDAIIIDPGKMTHHIVDRIENDHLHLKAVLITHNHGSHSRGLNTLRKIYSPAIYAADWEVAGSETIVLKGNGILRISGFTVGYLAAPGHSPDSMCYKIGRIIFTGDAMSAGLTGSTNNSYAKRTLITHVQQNILSQSDDIVLMPGHGPPTSVGAEKMFNSDFGYDFGDNTLPLD